jgi:hypothetical protein
MASKASNSDKGKGRNSAKPKGGTKMPLSLTSTDELIRKGGAERVSEEAEAAHLNMKIC